MWQPWVAHYFPGLGPLSMGDVRWSMYVAMWDMVNDG